MIDDEHPMTKKRRPGRPLGAKNKPAEPVAPIAAEVPAVPRSAQIAKAIEENKRIHIQRLIDALKD
jgi:hypothetical protein